jgi:hypothetical protein
VFVVCPDCGADQQEVGKYCENCGRLITAADAQAAAAPAAGATPWNPGADPGAAVAAGATLSPPPAASAGGGGRFAVVRNGQANVAEGFTITHAGEFLVGRPNVEAGTGVDIDLRQFVQPLVTGDQKQYLVHRSQCFIGLADDGTVTIRPCPGAENDTLAQVGGMGPFTPLAAFGAVRPARPDSSYPLEPGDRLFMGDPSALPYYVNGDLTAAGTYLVLELQGS